MNLYFRVCMWGSQLGILDHPLELPGKLVYLGEYRFFIEAMSKKSKVNFYPRELNQKFYHLMTI